jgi:hypothetical protein
LVPEDAPGHLEELVVRERGKLARQLHDEVAPAMFAAKLSLDIASGLAAKGAAGEKLLSALDDAVRSANAAMSALRATCAELGEPAVKDVDIFGDLTGLLRRFEQETGTSCGLSIQCDCAEFGRESAVSILEEVRDKLSKIAGRTNVGLVQVDILANQRQYDLKVHSHAIDESAVRPSVRHDLPPIRGGGPTGSRENGTAHPAGTARKNGNSVKTARGIEAEVEQPSTSRPKPVVKVSRQSVERGRTLGSE